MESKVKMEKQTITTILQKEKDGTIKVLGTKPVFVPMVKGKNPDTNQIKQESEVNKMGNIKCNNAGVCRFRSSGNCTILNDTNFNKPCPFRKAKSPVPASKQD